MAVFDANARSTEPELMDTEPVDFAEFQHCLRDLETINRLTLAYRPTLHWLGKVLARRAVGAEPGGEQPLAILDAGSGHGDMLRRIWRWAEARGIAVDLTGIDINPWAEKAAVLATPAAAPIRYLTSDIFALPAERRFDVVISSLFAHHLSDEVLVAFLRWMERHATRGWFINDLHRHAVSYHAVRHVVTAWSRNRMVRHDGPVSVARAFTRRDWTDLIARAGIAPGAVSIDWYFPFRYGVGRVH